MKNRLTRESEALLARLDEAETTLGAIRSGDWDALVVAYEGNERILTLKQSEIRYRRLFETAQYGILILDAATGRIEDINPHLTLMSGYAAADFVGKAIWVTEAFQEAGSVKDAFLTLQNSESVHYDDLELRMKQGTLLHVEFVGNAYPSDGGNLIQCSIGDISARKRTEAKIQLQLEHLTALSAIDRVIAGNFDLKSSLSEILTHVTRELRADAADILILNPDSQTLESGAEWGFRSKTYARAPMQLGESHAGRVVLERRLVQIADLAAYPDPPPCFRLEGEGMVGYFGVPLLAKGQIKGVLEVFLRTSPRPDADWIDFLKTLAGQTAIAIESSALFESLQRSNSELTLAYEATIEGWSRALDLRDKETEGHSRRVTDMTLRLARTMGIEKDELVHVRRGALLHDIGKMGVPDGILSKPGPLTDEEWVVMKMHPVFALQMLSPIFYLRRALDIPHYHHEKWDGSGYPDGLKGSQIPLVARLFAVVDVWDALKSDRPYRAGWPEERVRGHILASSGSHFDPLVVETFLGLPGL